MLRSLFAALSAVCWQPCLPCCLPSASPPACSLSFPFINCFVLSTPAASVFFLLSLSLPLSLFACVSWACPELFSPAHSLHYSLFLPHFSLTSPASSPPLSFTLTDFATVAIAKVVAIFVSSCLPLLLQLRLCLGFWSWFVVYSSTSFSAPTPLPGSTPSASSSRCVWSALFRTT